MSLINWPRSQSVSRRSRVRILLKPWFFQASSFQLLKLENLLRRSFFTLTLCFCSKRIYQKIETVFLIGYLKHLDFRQKYSSPRNIFNSLLVVWISRQNTVSLVWYSTWTNCYFEYHEQWSLAQGMQTFLRFGKTVLSSFHSFAGAQSLWHGLVFSAFLALFCVVKETNRRCATRMRAT